MFQLKNQTKKIKHFLSCVNMYTQPFCITETATGSHNNISCPIKMQSCHWSLPRPPTGLTSKCHCKTLNFSGFMCEDKDDMSDCDSHLWNFLHQSSCILNIFTCVGQRGAPVLVKSSFSPPTMWVLSMSHLMGSPLFQSSASPLRKKPEDKRDSTHPEKLK